MTRKGNSESAEHKELKRLALGWALEQGYAVAAAEVSLPNYRFRLDVGAYRPGRIQKWVHDEQLGRPRKAWEAAVGVTAAFECKASKPDFRRDARSMEKTLAELKVLHERKTRIERELCLFYPSIRNGDSLFQEYETLNFEQPGHERYQRTLDEIGRLTLRLHANTKFERLVKWNAANVFYVVAEPDAVASYELPSCWGLLVREGGLLRVVTKPVLHEVGEAARLSLLHRISMAATRAVFREHAAALDDLRCPPAATETPDGIAENSPRRESA